MVYVSDKETTRNRVAWNLKCSVCGLSLENE